MDMKNVELMIAADLRHFYRKRQRVVWIFEESVIVNDDGMEEKSWGVGRHAKRAFVADEVHLMPHSGQLFAERGSKDPAPAHRGVACNADPQLIARHTFFRVHAHYRA